MALNQADRDFILNANPEGLALARRLLHQTLLQHQNRISVLAQAGKLPRAVADAWRDFLARWVAFASSADNANKLQLMAFAEDTADWTDRIAGLERNLPGHNPNAVLPPSGPMLTPDDLVDETPWGKWLFTAALVGGLAYVGYRYATAPVGRRPRLA